jgi:hypothetical protein
MSQKSHKYIPVEYSTLNKLFKLRAFNRRTLAQRDKGDYNRLDK